MPLFKRVRDKLRRNAGKIVSGVGVLLIMPLVVRVVSDASRWIVDSVRGSGGRTGGEPASELNNYDEWTKKELYRLAQDLDIPGRSKMRKAELIEAIEAYREGRP